MTQRTQAHRGTQHAPFGMVLIHAIDLEATNKLMVTLYGNDQGANNVLDAVTKAAERDADLNVDRIPGLGSALPHDIHDRIHASSAVILGISSYMPEAKLAAQALERNPALAGNIFFVQDGPHSTGIQDPVLRSIGRDARLCTILDLQNDALERTVYRSVHTVGYPDHWFPSMHAIQDGTALRVRGAVQKRHRGTAERCPLAPEDIVVYFSGYKDPTNEADVLRYLFSLGSIGGRPLIVHFRPHPGERAGALLDQKSREAVDRAIRERDALLEGQWEIEIADTGDFMDSWLIGAADVTLAHPGSTSRHLVAALRKKMICCRDFVAADSHELSSQDFGLAAHSTLLVERLSDIEEAIAALARDDSPESKTLRRKQEKNALPFDAGRPPHYGQNVIEIVKRFVG